MPMRSVDKCRLGILLALGLAAGTASDGMAQGLAMDAGPGGVAAPGTAPASGAPPLAAAPAFAPAPAPAPAFFPTPVPVVAAPPPRPQPITMQRPRVVDTGTLQSGVTTVTLYGIEGLSGASAQGLQSFLQASGDMVTCQAEGAEGFVCLMKDGTDVAQVALVNGAAQTRPDAPEAYREQEYAAQTARRGIWANLPPPPDTITHPIVQDTGTLIGNGKIYTLSGVVGFVVPYSTQLQAYIAANGDTVTCAPQGYPGEFICTLPDNTDLAKVALVNGAASVAPDAPDSYRLQQLDALKNRRGFWGVASPDIIAAVMVVPPPDPEYVFVAGDDGFDGITYVGGAPWVVIEGEPDPVFLVYGDDALGWGYYDHFHHWQPAPDRYRDHLDRFHPGGRGLRGYEDHHFGHALGGPRALAHEAALRGGPGRAGFAGHPGMPVAAHPGFAAGRPGMPVGGRPGEVGRPGAVGHPGEVGRPGAVGHPGEAGRPGVAGRPGEVARPGPASAHGVQHAAASGGFVHPGAAASAGGFHPGARAPAAHAAAAPAQKKK